MEVFFSAQYLFKLFFQALSSAFMREGGSPADGVRVSEMREAGA